MVIHPDLRSQVVSKEALYGFAILAAIIAPAFIACIMVGILYKFAVGFLALPVIVLGRIMLPLILIELGALDWKRRLSRAYSMANPQLRHIELWRLSSNYCGDPLYPLYQPLRSFPKALLKVKVQTQSGEEELDFFSFQPITDCSLLGEVEAKVFQEPKNGEIMCIEVGDLRIWRSLCSPFVRTRIPWEIIPDCVIPIELPALIAFQLPVHANLEF